MDRHMLSTKDNPYDYFSEFDQWYAWDQRAGYCTLAYLDRVLRTSDELSEADQSLAREQAIDDIVKENGDLYIKVAVPK
jgi:nicotinic acid mononucleotide adenylyltransferase